VQWCRGRAASIPSRDDVYWGRRIGLLRRVVGGRLQPANQDVADRTVHEQ